MDEVTRRSLLLAGSALATATSSPAQNTPSEPVRQQPDFISGFWEPGDRDMVRWLEIPPTARILDAGCGRGDHVRLFAEQVSTPGAVTALDIKPAALEAVALRLRGTSLTEKVVTKQGDILKLPFPNQSFDLAWASHVLHGQRDYAGAVQELRRVVKPGGRVVLRENRISSALLPYDVGFGRPSLEYRTDLLFLERFAADRIERGRCPFGWLQVLQNGGCRDVRAKSLVMEAQAPWTEDQKAYIVFHLRRKLEEKQLEEEDRKTLQVLLDENSPQHVLKRRDLYFTSINTMYIGVV